MTQHLERDALVELRLVGRIDEQLEVGVGVHVDEAGADEQPVGIDHSGRGLGRKSSDRSDTAAGDADVGGEPRIAGPVDDPAAANQQVEHRALLLVLIEVRNELARHPLVAREQAAVDGDHCPRDP